MPIAAAIPSLEEIILSFHSGMPWLMWIHFHDKVGAQKCAACGHPQKSLVMTSPTSGICDPCFQESTMNYKKPVTGGPLNDGEDKRH